MPLEDFYNSLKELGAESDKNLKRYFLKTEAIKALEDFESDKSLALGLKGIGKTAAFRYLTEFSGKNDIVVGINSENYSVFLENRRLNYSACKKQFEHDLVVEALRAIDENSKKVERKLGKDKGRQLTRRAKAQLNSYYRVLEDAFGRISGVSILGCGFTVKESKASVLVGLRPDKDIAKARDTLKEICEAGVNIRIVIDDPELVFSIGQDLDVHLIGGLFLAAVELSKSIKNLKIIVLIKTHVYYPIVTTIGEIFSKHPDSSVRLSWDKSELFNVIDNRIRWANIRWSDLFDGSAVEAKEMVKESMCQRLRSGPRELLRWFHLALDYSDQERINQDIIESVAKELSIFAFKSLEVPFKSVYPRMGEVIKIIFHNNEKKEFSREELIEHIEDLQVNRLDMSSLWNLSWLQVETPRTLIDILFEVGSIAFGFEDRLVIPYEELYHNENFEKARFYCLTPALIGAI